MKTCCGYFRSKEYFRLFLLFILSSFLTITTAREAYSEAKRASASIQDQNGFFALSIPLDHFARENGEWKIRGRGLLNGEIAAISLAIIKHPVIGEKMGEYSVFFDFSEVEAKRAIAAFTRKFTGKPLQNIKKNVLFEAVGIEDAGNFADGLPRKFEVLNLHDEPNYGEWYLSIDQEGGTVTFSEKNHSYRDSFITAISNTG